jgi:hypothetical protein
MKIDQSDLAQVMAQLKGLPREVNAELRKQVRPISAMMARQINGAFARGDSPQAHRFSGSAKPKSDRMPAVNVGGKASEGGFVNGMAVMMAVEYGSRLERFHATPRASGHVIGPALTEISGTAWRWYTRTLEGVVRDMNAKT